MVPARTTSIPVCDSHTSIRPGIMPLKLGSSPTTPLAEHPRSYGIYSPRLSSDCRWNCIQAADGQCSPPRAASSRMVDGRHRRRRQGWIVVSDDGDAPTGRPGGSFVLLVGSRRLSVPVGARLDPATKRPAERTVSIQHFHSRGVSWKNTVPRPRRAIAGSLATGSSSIWASTPATSG